MAALRDELILEIDQALRAIDQIEQALNRSLGAVEIRVDATQAQRQLDQLAQSADQALGDVDVDIDSTGAARLNSELAGVERNLAQSDVEADQLASSVRQVDRAASDVNATTKDMSGSFGRLEGVAKGLVAAFAAIGVGRLFGGALRGANDAIQSFARLEDSINAVNVVFGEGAAIVSEFGETAAQSAGLSQEAFNNAVAPIGALLTNFGFNAREAADASVILIQRGADLASVYGGSVQDALLAINSALVGQVEPLRRFGGEISQARVEAFALATGLLQAGQEMDNTVAVQARLGLILQDTAVVAGDFVNTSDDLANAQRSAAAAATDFSADIGEVLAPALEVIVGLVPEIIEGLRQLVPGFAAAADSAAVFIQEASGGEDGGGFMREFFATLRAGAGDIGEIVPGLGDLATVIGTSVVGNVDAADRALARLDTRLARSQLRTIGTVLARDLDSGIDATEAFIDSINEMGSTEDVIDIFTQAYRDFAIQANLTVPQLQAGTREILANAEAAGLGADEIAFLTLQLAGLDEALDTGGRANADYLASIAGIGGVITPLSTETTRFVTFLGEIPPAMVTTASQMREAARAMGEALNPFEEAAEDIDVSADEFFQRLIEEINEQAEFQGGIAELIMRKQFALAEFLGEQGPAVQDALTGFLDDVDLAAAANAGLAGEGTAFSRAVGNELTSALASGNLTPDVEAAFLDMLDKGIFSNTQVENGILVGTGGLAETTSDDYFLQLGNEIDNFDASFLQDKLANLFSGVTFDIDASQFNFPDSGAFQGTIGAGAVLGTLATPQTGVTGTSPVANSFGFTYAPTVINPVVEDLETTLAKNNQIMGSVAGILNGNFKL